MNWKGCPERQGGQESWLQRKGVWGLAAVLGQTAGFKSRLCCVRRGGYLPSLCPLSPHQ